MPSVMLVFLDVGQGDGTLIIGPGEELMLIDIGSKKNAAIAGQDAVTATTTYILRSKKDRGLKDPYLDWLLLTHGDADHFNLWSELVQKVKQESGDNLYVGKAAIGGSINDYSGHTDIYNFLLQCQKDGNLITFSDSHHDAIGSPTFKMSGGAARIYVISANYPFRDKGAKNPKSLVTMLVYADRSVILTGDAEKLTEDAILAFYKSRPDFLPSFALKLGHHGSVKGSSEEWVKAVNPKACFASADMKWAHPYCKTITRIKDEVGSGRPLYQHWWMCGKGSGESKEYEQSNNKAGFYTTMAWMTESPTIDPETGKWIAKGLVQGVQHQLQIFDDGEMQLTDTLKGDSGKFNPDTAFAPLSADPDAPAREPRDAAAVLGGTPAAGAELSGCCGDGPR